MKPKLFLLAVSMLAAATLCAGTPPTYQWHTFYNNPLGNGYIDAKAVAADSQGNIYVAGTCGYNNQFECWPNPVHSGDYGYLSYVMKLAPNGTRLWHNIFNGQASTMMVTADGGVYVAGYGSPNGLNGKNPNYGAGVFLLKVDAATGAYLWHTTWGGFACGIEARGLAYDAHGGFVYVTGFSPCDWGYSGLSSPLPGNPYPGGKAMYLLQVSNAGAFGWYGFYTLGGYAHALALAMDAAGDFYLAGDDVTSGHDPLVVVKMRYVPGPTPPTSAALQVLWRYNNGAGAANSIALDGAGSLYVCGNAFNFAGPAGQAPLRPSRNNGFASDAMVMKLDTNGNYQWHTFYYPPGGAGIGAAQLAVDGGNVYVTGLNSADLVAPAVSIHQSPVSVSGHYLLQLNSSGAYQWHTVYGDGAYADEAQSIAVDASHNVAIAGVSWGPWYGDGNALPLQPQANLSLWVMRFVNATPAPTATTASNVVTSYSPSPRIITLTASVTSASGTVNSGSVSFTLLGNTVSGAVSGGVASAAFTVPGGTAFGTYTIQADYVPGPGLAASSDSAHALTLTKAPPVLTWSTPADIAFGTALGAAQLNAGANVPGTFVYTPAAGTILAPGNGQALFTRFTSADSTNYATGTATVYINVLAAPVQLSVTRTLSREVSGMVRVAVTITNTGGSTAQNVTLTIGKIGATSGTPLPAVLGNLAPLASGNATIVLPASVGGAGAAAVLTLGGTYTGGSFNNTTRVILP